MWSLEALSHSPIFHWCDHGRCYHVTMRLCAQTKVVWGKPSFHPAIHYEPPRVLSPKLWFRLWPAHEKLRHEHVLAPQCDRTVDLTILTVLLNWWFISVHSSLWIKSTLPKSMDKIYFVIRASVVSNIKPRFSNMPNFQSWQSIDVCPSQINIPHSLQEFDLSTRLDGLFHGNKSMVRFDTYTHPLIVQSND
jgi:hypothetical protein